jgi:hypothetical protein
MIIGVKMETSFRPCEEALKNSIRRRLNRISRVCAVLLFEFPLSSLLPFAHTALSVERRKIEVIDIKALFSDGMIDIVGIELRISEILNSVVRYGFSNSGPL